MYLYLLVGIIGCILPISEKYILQRYNFKNVLLARYLTGVFLISIIILYNKSLFKTNSLKKLTSLSWKEYILMIAYLILTFTFVFSIHYIYNRDLKKNYSISQIIPMMSVIAVIIIFLVDLIIFKHKFSVYNYVALILLILGIILMRFF